jgi:hypothetical protein
MARDPTAQVATRASCALWNLLHHSDNCAVILRKDNGVTTLTEILAYPLRRDVHNNVTGCLVKLLARNALACQQLCEAGGINTLMKCLDLFRFTLPDDARRVNIELIFCSLAEHADLVFAYDLVPRFLEMQSNTYHVLQEMGTNVYEVIRETLGREKVTLDPATGCDFTGLDSLVNSPMYHDLILLVNDSRLYAHKVLFSLFPYILQT